jgi:hypothetical protein
MRRRFEPKILIRKRLCQVTALTTPVLLLITFAYIKIDASTNDINKSIILIEYVLVLLLSPEGGAPGTSLESLLNPTMQASRL